MPENLSEKFAGLPLGLLVCTPIIEVAVLFIGIFATMAPAMIYLNANASSLGLTAPWQFFYSTGAVSSFLDNAPTYVVFFNTAGGDPNVLMTTMSDTLVAISAGAVFMGANTYIGNAPNFMVRSIAEDRGVAMPSFFGYMMWSCGILVPIFLLITFIFF